MKSIKLKFSLLLIISSLAFIGCKKDFGDASKITYLPNIELLGSENVFIVAGDTYVESGASADVNGTPIDYTISGTVDTTTPGVYVLSYLATNSDGFSASVERTVFVLDHAFVPGSAELTGTYKRSANNRQSIVTKLADGVYKMSDAWGSASSGGQPLPVPAYLFCTDGVNIIMPQVSTVFGRMEGTGTFNGTQMAIYTVLLDQGPFARTNTWIKQ